MLPVKHIFENVLTTISGIVVSDPLEGHNQSRQYIGYVEYEPAAVDSNERIKFEVGLREPLLVDADVLSARTLLMNPFTNQSVIDEFNVSVMTLKEAYAEKCRAALSRRKPAIRDFFDLHHASLMGRLDFADADFKNMIRKKLAIPGNDSVNLSETRRNMLIRQIDAELRPVLRLQDFQRFDLDEAFGLVKKLVESI